MGHFLGLRETPNGGVLVRKRMPGLWMVVAMSALFGAFHAVATAHAFNQYGSISYPLFGRAAIGLGVCLLVLATVRHMRLETRVEGGPVMMWTQKRLITGRWRTACFASDDVVEMRVVKSKMLQPAVYLIVKGHDPLFMLRVRWASDESVQMTARALGVEVTGLEPHQRIFDEARDPRGNAFESLTH